MLGEDNALVSTLVLEDSVNMLAGWEQLQEERQHSVYLYQKLSLDSMDSLGLDSLGLDTALRNAGACES